MTAVATVADEELRDLENEVPEGHVNAMCQLRLVHRLETFGRRLVGYDEQIVSVPVFAPDDAGTWFVPLEITLNDDPEPVSILGRSDHVVSVTFVHRAPTCANGDLAELEEILDGTGRRIGTMVHKYAASYSISAQCLVGDAPIRAITALPGGTTNEGGA
jgi:hypothetical protein